MVRRTAPRPPKTSASFQPAWSPDGQYIAYVTWNDLDGGTVSRVRADGSGRPEKLSAKPAYYEKPAYSIDGRRIVVGRGPRNMRKDREELERPPAQAVGVELVWLPGAGGAETLIAPISNFGRPHFVTTDTAHIYFAEGSTLVSMRWDGTDQKTILRSGGGGRGAGGGGGGGAGEMTISPDGQKVLVQAGVKAYLIQEVPKTGNAPTINATNPAQSEVPVRKITGIGGEFSTWSRDSRQIFYALGHSLFTYDVAAAEVAVRDSITKAEARADSANAAGGGGGGGGRGGGRGGAPVPPIYEPTRRDIVITVPKDKPQGTVVLRGARILTMKGSEVIPKGDIVVTNNRIIAVGAQGKVDHSVGRQDHRRHRQDDHARVRRHPRAHVAGVRRPPVAAVRVPRQPRLRRDDDARPADVDDRRAVVRGHGRDGRVHRPARSLRPAPACSPPRTSARSTTPATC